jgi:hypothetical protein
MDQEIATTPKLWGLATEKYFYFFMGLRKGEIRKQVAMMKSRYPDDTPRQLARRFVASQAPLSLLGGALFHVPMFVPTLGPAIKLLGIAAGSSLMVRLNMTLILQIALLFGYDIDSRERLKELIAIIGATGLAGATSQFPQLAGYPLNYRGLIGGAAVMTTSQLIGEAAIRYYGRGSTIEIDVPEGSPVTA